MEDDKLAVYPVLKRTGGVRLSVYTVAMTVASAMYRGEGH